MDVWVFKLPTPPTANNLFVNVQGVGRVVSKKYTAWRKEAAQLLQTQRRPAEPITYHVALDLKIPQQKGDISNRIKAPEDALVKAGILKDDSLVRRVSAEWTDGVDCIATLTRAEDAARRVG